MCHSLMQIFKAGELKYISQKVRTFLMIEDLVKALEMISVTPAFLRSLIEKSLYLSTAASDKSLVEISKIFMESTQSVILNKRLSPAGYYTGVWCRDASYILNEMLELGKVDLVGKWIEWIWSFRVTHDSRFVRGRGSPELGFRMSRMNGELNEPFDGLLPSSIQYRYCEVYAKSPDIDSTALMISTTCNYLNKLEQKDSAHRMIPILRASITSLERMDVDGDSLLEQGPNEDWMDNMLRSGKVVYSQSVWGLALKEWAKLLNSVGKHGEAEINEKKCKDIIKQVDSKLWYNDSFYADVPSRIAEDQNQALDLSCLRQDASLFLLLKEEKDFRAIKTLDAIKNHLWKDFGVACTSVSASTGPMRLKPYNYQNGAFWPWSTSFEISARLRHSDISNSERLLRATLPYSALEWINPFTKTTGSFPFKTSIAAMRTILRQYLNLEIQ